MLDLMIFGTLWNSYKGKWTNLIVIENYFLGILSNARKKLPAIKSNIDWLRGKLISKWLDKKQNSVVEPTSKNLKRFISWLNATGDFSEEAKRIKMVVDPIDRYPHTMRAIILNEIFEYADWFENYSKQTLGKYTIGVESFLAKHPVDYKGREDYFFCGRKEVEYHLNMVGAAIMNKALRKDFLQSENKILLLPTCMAKNDKCRAINNGNAIVCNHCTAGCNISKTSREMEKIGVTTILIKHSSDFSKWLLPWANQTKTALIGTACALNLLQGGFEMKKLAIPAQCIFLDYCGCKKHWDKNGLPTEININKVRQMVNPKNSISPRLQQEIEFIHQNKFAV